MVLGIYKRDLGQYCLKSQGFFEYQSNFRRAGVMLRWGSHQYNLKRNWSLVFLFLFRVSTAEMDTWVAPGFLIVQEKATKPIITSDAPLWSPQPDPLCDSVTCPGSACLLYTEVCESKMDKTVWTMIFSPFTQQRNSRFFSARLKNSFPQCCKWGILWFPQKQYKLICLHCRKQMSKGKLNVLVFPKLLVCTVWNCPLCSQWLW